MVGSTCIITITYPKYFYLVLKNIKKNLFFQSRTFGNHSDFIIFYCVGIVSNFGNVDFLI